MYFVEDLRVSEERAQAGFRAEVDRPSMILGAWIILRVGIAEDPPAERDEPLRAGSGLFCRFAF